MTKLTDLLGPDAERDLELIESSGGLDVVDEAGEPKEPGPSLEDVGSE